MLRILIAMMAVVALAVPAMGYGTQWEGSPSGQLEIHLALNCYIQIEWQETWIVFNGTTDWWSRHLDNVAYAACPDSAGKWSTDPWGGDAYYAPITGIYYESGDGAVIFVRSNNDLSMAVTTNGDLLGQTNAGNLDTWFTVCLAPFQIGGVALAGSVPTGGQPGHYLYDAGSAVFGHADDGGANPVPGGSVPAGYDNWPDQYAFPCVGSQTWTLGSMSPYIEGTIKFLGRVHRHGMADAGDDYKTTLDVLFTTP